jgi:hypothetical protein
MAHQFVVYRDVPVICENAAGVKYLGDIPVIRYNEITKIFESVVNTRGYGYAGRDRLCYRNR